MAQQRNRKVNKPANDAAAESEEDRLDRINMGEEGYARYLALKRERERCHTHAANDKDDPSGPPRNIEAEQALLSAFLNNNEVMDRLPPEFAPEHFYDELHQEIFRTCAKLYASNRPADALTLKPFFMNAEPIDATMTVPQYLGRLQANVTTTRNAPDYARTVRDLAIRRQLIIIGENIRAVAFDSPVDFSPQEQIEDASDQLFRLSDAAPVPGSYAFADALETSVRQIDAVYRRGDGLAGISTGIASIDEATGGICEGEQWVLGARPSMGKTALALNILTNAAAAGVPCALISLEMSAAALATRHLAAATGLSGKNLRRGRLNGSADMALLLEAKQRLATLPLWIEESTYAVAQIRSVLRRLKRKHGIRLVAIDYLSLMQVPRDKGKNYAQDVGSLARDLRTIARDLHIGQIVLCQLNRKVEERENKRPQLADLRDSGEIEAHADVIAFLYREEYYLLKDRPADTNSKEYLDWREEFDKWTGRAELLIPKSRQDEAGITAWLGFNAPTMTFTAGSPPHTDGGDQQP